MKTRIVLTFLLLIMLSFDCYSQKAELFNPSLWIYNHQKVNDTTASYDILNFRNKINSSKTAIWSSSKKINNSNHFFLVYKSKKDEYLISFLGDKNSLFLDGKKHTFNDSIALSGYNETYGELMDIGFSNIENGRFWMNANLKNSNIYEMILVNTSTYQKKINEIRTYLSIKYGIDLIDHKKYVYKGKNIWNGELKKFNNSIFGIGYFAYFNLLQTKSIHSKDQDLTISFSDPGNIHIQDGSYILLGNNGKNFIFDDRTHNNKKEWLAQTNVENSKVNLTFPIKLFEEEALSEYELIVQNNSQKTTYSPTLEDSLIVFKNIPLEKDGHNIIQLNVQKPEVKLDYTTDCEYTQLSFDKNKKLNNFLLRITDDKNKVILTTSNWQESYLVNNEKTTYLDVTIEYNKKILHKRIRTIFSILKESSLKEYYFLEKDEMMLSVDRKNERGKEIYYQWNKDGKEIGNGTSIYIKEEGNYELVTYLEKDCFIKQSFSVLQQNDREAWVIYPNPADSSDELQATFNLSEKSTIDISIYQIDGKLIKKIPTGKLQKETISLGKLSSGTYIILVYINQSLQIKKILIK